MSQSNIFDSLHLRDNLEQAITRNCKIEMRADGVKTFRFQGISGIEVSSAPQAMRALSRQLYELIPLNGTVSVKLLANHMLQVAIFASHSDVKVIGPPTRVKQLDLLKRNISIDFALICALSLAHNHGYSIRLETFQWKVMHSVLEAKDDDSLIQKFRESLSKARSITEASHAGRLSRRTERVLSAESYANLASIAFAENWDERVVLTLIEEHLSPTLHPSFVYYSNTVSGDDWRKLYEYICRLTGDCGMQSEQIESAIISVTVGKQGRLPVDLNLIVDQVGAVIRYTSCRDAFTHFKPSGPVIYVSSTEPNNEKKRFVVAHELAHIMLRSPAAIDLIERQGQAKLLDNEEDLANQIAGTLLVPDNLIDGMKREQRLAPARLQEIARRAGIPISMLITRMEKAGIDIALLHWHRGRRGSWHVIDRPGTPLLLHGYVEISALGRRALDHLGCGESEVIVDCRANGVWARIKGRTFRSECHNEHVFQFLAPESDISFPA